MRIASVMAGFTLGEADLLRRAISKKSKDELDAERQHFLNGSIQNGYTPKVANEVYDLIVRFANYGFPKGHAVAYSLISYTMAYLKTHFTPYFYAALLTNTLGDREKNYSIMREARSKGIELLPPSIEKSGFGHRVEGKNIRLGLNGIKGVPKTFLNRLRQLRQDKRANFTSIFEMALAFSGQHFKRKAIEPLVKAGALDNFGRDRAILLATIDSAEKHANLYATDEETALFYDTAVYGVPKYVKAEVLTENERLQFEKEVLGYYISAHPVATLRANLNKETISLSRVSSIKEKRYVKCVAFITNVKKIRTKKGEQMAFVQLEDDEGDMSATIFPNVFEQQAQWIEVEQFIYVEGFIEYRNNAPQLIVKKIEHLQ